MSIRLKLLLGFLGVSLLGALIGLVGIISLAGVKAADTRAYENGTQGLITMFQVFNAVDDVKVSIRDEALSTTDSENQRAADVYKAGVDQMRKGIADYEKTVADAADRANLDRLKAAADVFYPVAAQVVDFGLQNMNQQAADVLQSPGMVKAKDNLDKAVDDIIGFNIDYNTRIFQENSASTDASILTMAIILVLGIVFSIGAGLLVTNSITRPVRRVNDELGDASKSLESASLQVSSSSQQLSSSSSELASSIEEMTSSLEELQSIIEANTKNVNQSELLMQETTRDSKKVSVRMGELKEALGDISGQSKKIAKIIKVIDDIAFQTNILALNAAVEAARAGDAGKGFAVVADQVKALAQKSADAAKETADLIEKAIGASDRGETLGNEVKEAQDVAAEKAEKVAVLLDEVNRGSKEQLKGANQITQAVSQVNAIVQTTASSSEETAAAGEELLSQAEGLSLNVQQLSQIINGKNAQVEAPARRLPPGHGRPGTEARTTGRAQPVLGRPQAQRPAGVEVTKPEDIIPLKDFKDY